MSDGSALVDPLLSAGRARALPTATAGRDQDGAASDEGGFFLGGVWISPVPIDFGLIFGEKEIVVSLLSTIRSTQTLSDVDVSFTTGLTVAGSPLNIDFLGADTVTITAEEQGPLEFSGNTLFVFTDITLAVLTQGQRLSLFDAAPERPVTETLLYATSIIRSEPGGQEQRISQRVAPRQRVNLRYSQDNRTQFSKAKVQLAAFQGNLYSVPWWQEARFITAETASTESVVPVDTADIDWRAGGTAYFLLPNGASVTGDILSIQADSITLVDPVGTTLPARTEAMPMRNGYIIGSPSGALHPVNLSQYGLVFENTDLASFADDPASLGFTIYEGEALLDGPNLMPGATIRWQSNVPTETFDPQSSSRAVFQKAPRAVPIFGRGVFFRTHAELRKWRSLVDNLYGSWGQFYIPSMQDDFELAADLEMDAGDIEVENIGVSLLFGTGAFPYADIYFVLDDGRTFARRITATQDNGATETISFSPLGAAETVPAAEVMVSWLHLARISGDRVDITHEGGGRGKLFFMVEGLTAA